MASEIAVCVIDDNDSSAVWDLRFAQDRERRRALGDTRPGLFCYGDVCKTARAGRAHLLRALNDDLMPDVVLIDHVLSTGADSPSREAAGLDVMRWLRNECRKPRNGRAHGTELPKCVLWTKDYSPGLAYAFVQSGGTHAFGREVPADELLEQIWAVVDHGATWEHHGTPPKLELTRSQLLVMPYFEANLATHVIAERMIAAGELDRPSDKAQEWVNERRREIMNRANALLEQIRQDGKNPPSPPFEGRGLSAPLAKFAVEHGNIWIPLAYRE